MSPYHFEEDNDDKPMKWEIDPSDWKDFRYIKFLLFHKGKSVKIREKRSRHSNLLVNFLTLFW